MNIFGAISKSESQPDGTIKVWGVASSSATDSQGETVAPDAIRAAIPDYMRFGAVREMHGSTAAGTAISIDVTDGGVTNFCAHIVDPVSVLKVKTGVLKGFSIGGRATGYAPNDRSKITGLELTEISLVDRPSNPDSIITVFKAAKMTTTTTISKADEASQATELTAVITMMSQLLGRLQRVLVAEGGEPAEVDAAVDAVAADEPPPEATAKEDAPEDQAKPPEPPPEAVAKAGARFSGVTKGQLSELHDAVKKCDKHLDGLGYKDTAKASGELAGLKAEIAKLRETISKSASPRPHAGVAIDKTTDATGVSNKSPFLAGGIIEKSHAENFVRIQRERAQAAGQIIKL